MFENILVCLDGSELADTIIEYAREQARCFRSRLILLNVLDMPSASVPLSFAPGSSEKEQLLEVEDGDVHRGEIQAAGYLSSVQSSLLEEGINTESVIVRGTPAPRYW